MKNLEMLETVFLEMSADISKLYDEVGDYDTTISLIKVAISLGITDKKGHERHGFDKFEITDKADKILAHLHKSGE